MLRARETITLMVKFLFLSYANFLRTKVLTTSLFLIPRLCLGMLERRLCLHLKGTPPPCQDVIATVKMVRTFSQYHPHPPTPSPIKGEGGKEQKIRLLLPSPKSLKLRLIKLLTSFQRGVILMSDRCDRQPTTPKTERQVNYGSSLN